MIFANPRLVTDEREGALPADRPAQLLNESADIKVIRPLLLGYVKTGQRDISLRRVSSIPPRWAASAAPAAGPSPWWTAGVALTGYVSAAEIMSRARSSMEANGPTTTLCFAESTPGCGRVGAMAWAASTAEAIRLRSSGSSSP